MLAAPADWRQTALGPPLAFGDVPVTGTLRSTPEDFEVREDLGFTPDGDGTHWLLHVRKRGANTEWVAGQLARHGGVRHADVGFAGMKDRDAVTTQWFSVPRGQTTAEHWRALEHPEFEVLEAHAHGRKLRRGALAGNHFRVVVRQIAGRLEALNARLEQMRALGVPNYFGPQRFGRQGNNLEQLARWASPVTTAAPRQVHGLTLSTGRSLLFNAVLAARVERGDWNRLTAGDVANLDGSRSIFAVPEITAELEGRCTEFDIHPTGPLWGRGTLATQGAVRAFESAIVDRYAAVARALEAEGLEQERRSLRLKVSDLMIAVRGDALALEFRLPAGAYATTVLRELVRTGEDTHGADRDH